MCCNFQFRYRTATVSIAFQEPFGFDNISESIFQWIRIALAKNRRSYNVINYFAHRFCKHNLQFKRDRIETFHHIERLYQRNKRSIKHNNCKRWQREPVSRICNPTVLVRLNSTSLWDFSRQFPPRDCALRTVVSSSRKSLARLLPICISNVLS